MHRVPPCRAPADRLPHCRRFGNQTSGPEIQAGRERSLQPCQKAHFHHIRAIKIGPFESEEQLRKLCAEAGTSVVQNLDAIYGGLASRWLANFESGADNKLAQLTDRMLRTLELKARITKEVMPPGATLNQTLIVTPDIVNAVQAMKPTPEQREAFARAWRQIAPRVLIEHVAAAD